MELERKTVRLELKDAEPGSFRAVFSTFNVIDKDGDVTRPDAFTKGQEVRIAQWGHNWGALPVGKGAIDFDESKAWVDASFFLDTQAGADTYATVKNLGSLQEWSFGFTPTKHSVGDFDGQKVRFLEAIDAFEVSPVMKGAGIGTHTEAIKGHMSLEEESAAALAAAEGFRDRVKALAAVRAKEGRALSSANRDRLKRHLDLLAEIRADLEGLIAATESDPKAADPLAEFVRFQQLRARRLGVAI
jgi:HK97 family phage prohead protease